jgi:hypothetical protein
MRTNKKTRFAVAFLTALSVYPLVIGTLPLSAQAKPIDAGIADDAGIQSPIGDDSNPSPPRPPAPTNSNPSSPTPPAPTDSNPTGATTRSIEYYTTAAGLTNPAYIGQEKWVDACDVISQQGAGTFNSGVTKTCTYQTDNGWQMVESQIEVLENKHGRGSYANNIIAKDGQFNVNEQDIGAKWKIAIEAAVKAGDIEAKRKLDLEYQRNIQLIRSYSANQNTFFIQVTANGGLFRKSVIHVKARVKLVRIA